MLATKNDDWSDEIFLRFSEIAKKASGLTLTPEKSLMVQSRLRPRMKELRFETYREYHDFVNSDAGKHERSKFISALTTNVSYFFREPHHFSELEKQFKKVDEHKPIKIWSAGCSNGQEAVSIAITLLSTGKNTPFKILATDIDLEVLKFAKNSLYTKEMLGSTSESIVQKFFNEADSSGNSLRLKEEFRDLIKFKQLNLIEEWPMRSKFRFIFCRNVAIYFDDEIRARLWRRLVDALEDQAVLFIGHSERISKPEEYGIKLIGPTTYQKVSVA